MPDAKHLAAILPVLLWASLKLDCPPPLDSTSVVQTLGGGALRGCVRRGNLGVSSNTAPAVAASREADHPAATSPAAKRCTAWWQFPCPHPSIPRLQGDLVLPIEGARGVQPAAPERPPSSADPGPGGDPCWGVDGQAGPLAAGKAGHSPNQDRSDAGHHQAAVRGAVVQHRRGHVEGRQLAAQAQGGRSTQQTALSTPLPLSLPLSIWPGDMPFLSLPAHPVRTTHAVDSCRVVVLPWYCSRLTLHGTAMVLLGMPCRGLATVLHAHACTVPV
jgi:hypothetical protein